MKTKGKLILITGSMFGGKTTYLLSRIAEHLPVNRLLFKHTKDTRYLQNQQYGISKVVTHDGQVSNVHALVVDSPTELLEVANKYHFADLIAIDEAHFFPSRELRKTVDALLSDGKDVILAGLSRKTTGFDFDWWVQYLANAMESHCFRARCVECGKPAMNVNSITGKIVNATAEDVRPVCDYHHIPWGFEDEQGSVQREATAVSEADAAADPSEV